MRAVVACQCNASVGSLSKNGGIRRSRHELSDGKHARLCCAAPWLAIEVAPGRRAAGRPRAVRHAHHTRTRSFPSAQADGRSQVQQGRCQSLATGASFPDTSCLHQGICPRLKRTARPSATSGAWAATRLTADRSAFSKPRSMGRRLVNCCSTPSPPFGRTSACGECRAGRAGCGKR